MQKFGRVLLADSHLNMLGGVYSLLDCLFEIVLMVADERSLLDAVRTFAPDVVVVDLSLPVEGEANIVGRLLEQKPGLRIIVLSIHDEPTVASQMRIAGVAGFVLKRDAATHLIQVIHEVLPDRAYVAPIS